MAKGEKEIVCMKTKQQEEAIHYFEAHARDWQNKAESADLEKVNIIEQRNSFVLQVIAQRSQTSSALDVGCGTGDLVCCVARQGIKATGVDFAQEMVDIALGKAGEEKLDRAQFECCSIFDFNFANERYDVISANGFIEYISQDELNQFFDIVHEALTPGGSFVVGSRNRLYNMFSVNDFTLTELNEGSSEALLKEAVALASGMGIDRLSEIDCAPLQKPETQHSKTGIDVATRFQYTPLQLVRMSDPRGFEAAKIYPVHIHAVPPVFGKKHPEIHGSIANLLQGYSNQDMELVPFSSSFMLHLQKKDE
jgi:2-polyprenyl-3-methyl-5-hydroxy-6-metoxy-1,4-benzoquinol methylase